jgi:hypothetical protein
MDVVHERRARQSKHLARIARERSRGDLGAPALTMYQLDTRRGKGVRSAAAQTREGSDGSMAPMMAPVSELGLG